MFKVPSRPVEYLLRLLEPGDIVCRPTDLQNDWNSLRFGLSRASRGSSVTAYAVYVPKNNRPELYEEHTAIFSSISAYDQWEFQVRSKGIWISRLQLTDEAFLGAPFPLPPLPEQRAIVRYLDHVDDRIRRYIAAKEKLIALLEEERQAVIHRAVTRGLDPNVPLKPSGVDWLGDIPAHWDAYGG